MADLPGTIDRLNAALADRYRIERELGEGGMATVYLAEDLKHDRQVALKVLKPELAAVVGSERFLAEIRTTANLQHPGILPLHDSGEAASFLYYVMPYVEGESLRDRLDREHQLPVNEAVRIATDVAEALDYAHSHGVIHRDVKPANILLVAGRPVISDFGIALAVGAAGGGRLTETGLSLGTPHYMSPEQATGDAHVGPATDIYALGCVLYEMLTGDPPHMGSTAQAVLGKIITEPPVPITKQRKAVPPNVEATVARALEKLPADRFRSAGDFAKALGEPEFRYGGPGATVGGGGAGAGDVHRWKRASLALAAVAGLLAVGLTLALVVVLPRARAGSRPAGEIRFTIPLPTDSGVYLGGTADATFGRPSSTDIALSPDGSVLVYAGWKTEANGKVTSQLYRRPLGQEHADPIPGTGGASSPFFSPDGQWIGFFSGGSLKRVSLAGGNVQVVTPDAHLASGLQFAWGASWSEDGTILYGGGDGIYQVASEGGEPKLIVPNRSDSAGAQPDTTSVARYGQPSVLPGGRTLLAQDWASVDPKRAELVAIDLASGKRTTLLRDAIAPRFVPPDHLLFVRRGTLMGVGFDARRLRIVGQPVVVLEDVLQAVTTPNAAWDTGAAQVAISRSGDLAWVGGGTYPELPSTVFEIAPDGHATPLGWASSREYIYLRASPHGDRVAYSAGPGAHVNVYVRDLARGVTLRLNTGGYDNQVGAWSPDGASLLISSDRDGPNTNVYRIPADGSGGPARLAPSDQLQGPASWSSLGVIAYLQGNIGSSDIWTLPPGGKPTPFVATHANETYADFSPDGHWLAYVSDASGRDEVYVRPYPGPGAAIPVSGNGGDSPAWSPHGRRLYYIQGRTTTPVMMVADVVSRDPFRVGRARPLIDPWPYITTEPKRSYDILPDGSFIASKLQAPAGSGAGVRAAIRQMYRVGAVHMIVNFAAELNGKTP